MYEFLNSLLLAIFRIGQYLKRIIDHVFIWLCLQLISERLVRPDCTGTQPVAEHELAAVSKFFSRACVPGRWAPDEATDQLFSKQNFIRSLSSIHSFLT